MHDKITTIWFNHLRIRGTTYYDEAKKMWDKESQYITVHDIEYHPDDGSRRFCRQTPRYWCKHILFKSGKDAEIYGADAMTLEQVNKYHSCSESDAIDFVSDFPGHCNHPLWFHNSS